MSWRREIDVGQEITEPAPAKLPGDIEIRGTERSFASQAFMEAFEEALQKIPPQPSPFETLSSEKIVTARGELTLARRETVQTVRSTDGRVFTSVRMPAVRGCGRTSRMVRDAIDYTYESKRSGRSGSSGVLCVLPNLAMTRYFRDLGEAMAGSPFKALPITPCTVDAAVFVTGRRFTWAMVDHAVYEDADARLRFVEQLWPALAPRLSGGAVFYGQ